jgi:putative flippase GtrA
MVIRHPSLQANHSPLRFLSRYGKFLVVGMMNALVDIIVFNLFALMFSTHSPWLISLYNTVAVAAAICNSYVWNRHWTFSDVTTGTRQERIMFWGQAVLNILINDLVVALLTAYLSSFKSLSPYASSNLAKAAAMFTSSTVSYVVLRMFVFRSGSRTQGESTGVHPNVAAIIPLVPKVAPLGVAQTAEEKDPHDSSNV